MNTVIHTPARNLQKSLAFYQKLGFQLVPDDQTQFIADSQMLVELNTNHFARPGLKLYKESWMEEIEKLQSIRKLFFLENGFLINDGNGCWVYLVEAIGPGMSALPVDQKSWLGNFFGLSLEAADMEDSVRFWSILGFSLKQGKIGDSYLVMENSESFPISLMQPLSCPHLFFNPSLTFFNSGKNVEIIQRVREADIPITEEISYFSKGGEVDNIIIRDPAGYGLFVFND